MASSQPATSSPARSVASLDRFALSPQSRLKRLLAAVDSESDDDTHKTNVRKLQPVSRKPSVADQDPLGGASARVSDDDEDDVPRPRGRLAARMQGVTTELANGTRRLDVEMSGTRGVSDAEDDNTSRPKGRLASRMQRTDQLNEGKRAERENKSPSAKSTSQLPTFGTRNAEPDEDDEDDDIQVRTRKPNARRVRSHTPEPTFATPQRVTSPGLFVTPDKSPLSGQESPAAKSVSDDDMADLKSNRFKALVEKKRRERLAREAEETKKKESRAAALADLGDDNDDVSDITDDEGGRQLTQTLKPKSSRKASRKALEDMNRETQRIQRAMQLAHEAKTKKKITKSSLFERFNFKPSGPITVKETSSRPQTPLSAKSTDAEMHDAETPPSSPPARVEDVLAKNLKGTQALTGVATAVTSTVSHDMIFENGDEDLPDILDIQAFARKPLNKGRDLGTAKTAPKRQVRVKLPTLQANLVSLGSDDEDELVVVGKKKSKLDAIFDRVPQSKAKESTTFRLQRQLAHVGSPERKTHGKNGKSGMTLGELQAQLAQRAREQAKLERERRMDMLKAKGIHIQTEEERQRDREQIEDMVARARREAEEIMAREREEAKQEKGAREEDPLAWDESGSDDDEYVEGQDEDEKEVEADVEFSGSEDDEQDRVEGIVIDGDDDEEDAADIDADSELPKQTSAIVDDAAGEASESEGSDTEKSWVDPDEEDEKHRWGAESEDDVDQTPAFVQAMRPKQCPRVILEATPKPSKTHVIDFTPKPIAARVNDFTPGAHHDDSPDAPTSVLRSAAKTFIPGLPVEAGGPAGLGLTQIFAGTMDDSQAGPAGVSPSQPMPTFDSFLDSQLSQNAFNFTDNMVLDSQTVPATQLNTQGAGNETQIRLDFVQSQTHGLDSLLRDDLATQPSQLMDATQDGGFKTWTPLKERFVEPPVSTVDTVVYDPAQPDNDDMSHTSPLLQKRSRLRRKLVIASDSEEEADGNAATKPSVFNVMKDAVALEKKRKAKEEFNKKNSKAKEMFEEQAEESEDEYAGLGGMDGEDSDDDDLASVHEMIDDQTQGNKEEDELKIAALHAERARAEDAKQTDKLFNDITRGMLRRKRGADYDLSDSDDGGEARRRMKRRQFTKMQKALFADERISKVAENPRNHAFMRTIEDVGSDDEMDYLFESTPDTKEDSQQSSSTQENGIVPNSQTDATADPAAPAQEQRRASRRTKTDRKPATLGEIRETLSNLLDDPSGNSVVPATDPNDASDSESGSDGGSSSNKENSNPRRSNRGGPVIDRISLKRQSSSSASSAAGGGARMAFAAPGSSAGVFKVPALLRKATTNSLMSVGSSSGGTGSAAGAATSGGFGSEGKIKKSAGKRSGISYLARENDRRAKLAEAEKRREQKKFRAVEGRGKVVGGLFGAGKFE